MCRMIAGSDLTQYMARLLQQGCGLTLRTDAELMIAEHTWLNRTPSTHDLFDFHFSSKIYLELINPHTVGSLTIPRASIKWV